MIPIMPKIIFKDFENICSLIAIKEILTNSKAHLKLK